MPFFPHTTLCSYYSDSIFLTKELFYCSLHKYTNIDIWNTGTELLLLLLLWHSTVIKGKLEEVLSYFFPPFISGEWIPIHLDLEGPVRNPWLAVTLVEQCFQLEDDAVVSANRSIFWVFIPETVTVCLFLLEISLLTLVKDALLVLSAKSIGQWRIKLAALAALTSYFNHRQWPVRTIYLNHT